MGEARAQIELKFGQFDTRVPDKSFLDNENLNLKKPTIILEKAIDPEKYIIGSGDVFGININTMEKMFFPQPLDQLVMYLYRVLVQLPFLA